MWAIFSSICPRGDRILSSGSSPLTVMIPLPPSLFSAPAVRSWHGEGAHRWWQRKHSSSRRSRSMERMLMAVSFPWPRMRRAALLAGVSLLASCTVGLDFERPAPPETKGYTEDKEGLPPMQVADGKEKQQRLVLGQDIPGEWWQLFRSERL